MEIPDDVPLRTIPRRASSSSSFRTDDSQQSFGQDDPLTTTGTSARRNRLVEQPRGVLAHLRRYEVLLDRKFGLEGAGPERVLPEDQHAPNIWNIVSVWIGATLNLSCFAAGLLAWELGLTFVQSFWTILLGSFLGSAVAGWCAILGPSTGLRQVSISRYSMGYHPSRLIALLNVLTTFGFSAVSCIAAGFALTALSNNTLPPSVGITLICFIASFFSLVGLRGVMYYEKYAWIICGFIFGVVYLQVLPYADFTSIPTTSRVTAGFQNVDRKTAILSLLSISFGQCGGWASVTSDFYVHYSASTPPHIIFVLTTLSLGLSTLVGMSAGALVGSTLDTHSLWTTAYLSPGGIGSLLTSVLHPRLFATLVLILFVNASVGTNTLTIYTGALSLQQLDPRLMRIPRFIWTIIFFMLILAISIIGQNQLLPLLENLLATLGYYNTSFFVILACEHYIFRGGTVNNYDLDAWDDERQLPVGVAGAVAFVVGTGASLMGMRESWFVGPFARWCGGDVGNFVAVIVTGVVFLVGRRWERRVYGR